MSGYCEQCGNTICICEELQHQSIDTTNMIECATCGYPLTEHERTGLVEVNGKMHKPWIGLTDEEIFTIDDGNRLDAYAFARAIEAKIREKNS